MVDEREARRGRGNSRAPEKIKIPIDRKLAMQIKPRIGLCNVMSMMCRRIERQDFETNS